MAEKVYLTADQYVVKCLEEKEQEIVKLNEKYDDLLKKFLNLKGKAEKLENLKEWFRVEETSSGNGYQIAVRDSDGHYIGTVAYSWDKENLDQKFLDLLDLLGLSLAVPGKGDK